MLPDSRVSDNISYLRGNVMRAEREREREGERGTEVVEGDRAEPA